MAPPPAAGGCNSFQPAKPNIILATQNMHIPPCHGCEILCCMFCSTICQHIISPLAGFDIELKHWRSFCAQLAQGRMLDKHWGHGCNSRSIRCVQIGGSNNSIAVANSLTTGARVQKSWIMQWRPAGICCPTAIWFNIGQASEGITHWLNKWCRQLALLLCPAHSF